MNGLRDIGRAMYEIYYKQPGDESLGIHSSDLHLTIKSCHCSGVTSNISDGTLIITTIQWVCVIQYELLCH